MQDTSDYWTSLYSGIHRSGDLHQFASACDAEFTRWDVSVEPVVLYHDRTSSLLSSRRPVIGEQEFQALAHRERDRCAGSLIVSPLDLIEGGRVAFLERMSRGNRRVVWADLNGRYRLGAPFPSKIQICRPNFEGAMERAFEHLVDAGHRHIGFPLFVNHRLWALPFARSLRAAAGHQDKAQIHIHEERHQLLGGRPDGENPFDTLHRLHKDGISVVRAALDRLFAVRPDLHVRSQFDLWMEAKTARSPSDEDDFTKVWLGTCLVPLLQEKQVTALIAPRERYARYMYVWLIESGVRVPDDISLISIGNSVYSESMGLSSIDLGLSDLGYLAAHCLIRDIKMPRGRDNTITSQVHIVERNTVSSPGHRRTALRFIGDYQ